MQRRDFLRRAAGYATTATLTGSQLAQTAVACPAWSANPDAEATLIAELFPGLEPEYSDRVHIDAPFVTTPKLGFVAGVTAEAMRLDAVARMVAGEANPLAHAVRFHKAASRFRATMTMHRTAELNAYVLSHGHLYRNSLHIKVTQGGYGTNNF